mmetsp:Transcript_1943/g.3079  ORF Transcript_1943/g.3079 Transcript_1943/m.3079 type:complete len:203 (-) Transcript_1943:174-782(-)
MGLHVENLLIGNFFSISQALRSRSTLKNLQEKFIFWLCPFRKIISINIIFNNNHSKGTTGDLCQTFSFIVWVIPICTRWLVLIDIVVIGQAITRPCFTCDIVSITITHYMQAMGMEIGDFAGIVMKSQFVLFANFETDKGSRDSTSTGCMLVSKPAVSIVVTILAELNVTTQDMWIMGVTWMPFNWDMGIAIIGFIVASGHG